MMKRRTFIAGTFALGGIYASNGVTHAMAPALSLDDLKSAMIYWLYQDGPEAAAYAAYYRDEYYNRLCGDL